MLRVPNVRWRCVPSIWPSAAPAPRASLATAMRELAAVTVLAACAFHAHGDVTLPLTSRQRDTVPNQLLDLIGVSPHTPLHRVVECTQAIGPTKCLAALSIWRAEKAVKTLRSDHSKEFNFIDDLRQFPWKKFANSTQDELDGQLCEGTGKLLQYRALKFKMISGYELELASNGNGTLNVDISRDQHFDTSRGMKKMRKQFYNIVPFLLVPGLIMSAILPFVLPALKMMTVAVGMLNNMALSGAVFTLLRNNAFNDKYEKKVIYINKGYKNEQKNHHHHHETYHPDTVYEVQYDDKNNHEVLQGYDTMQVQSIALENASAGADFDIVEESPDTITNADWIKQYYGNNNKNVVTFAKLNK